MTGSLALNDWPTISDLVYGNNGNLSGWLLDTNLVIPDGIDVFNTDNQDFYGSLLSSIRAKAAQGLYVPNLPYPPIRPRAMYLMHLSCIAKRP